MQRQYFGTDGIRGKVGQYPVTPDFMMKLGWAVGKVLARDGSSKVLIGKDTRISGYMFESALEAGLSAAGVDIHLLGPMPTPGIAYLTRTFRAQVGIVISASHNPYSDNGIKFFSMDGFKIPDEVELAIERQMQEAITTVDPAYLGKAARVSDAAGRYIEYCKSTVPSLCNLTGLKIVIDCANGATYRIAPSVFRELGAQVILLGVKPDGLNINAGCGSTQPELLKKTVLAEQADIGIAFDGDGDRVLMIDHQGHVLDGDELLFIIAKNALLRNQLNGNGVVGTQMSNMGLEIGLQELGVAFKRTKVGDRYIIEELRKSSWVYGGESSGHIICLGVTTTGDGIIAALQVLYAMINQNKSLHELKQGMIKFPQVLVNVALTKSQNVLEHPDIQSAVLEIQTQLSGKGRVLLRPSGTEPLIRIMVEGTDASAVSVYAQQLAAVVRGVME